MPPLTVVALTASLLMPAHYQPSKSPVQSKGPTELALFNVIWIIDRAVAGVFCGQRDLAWAHRASDQAFNLIRPRVPAIMAENHFTLAETRAFLAGALKGEAAVTLNNAILRRHTFCDEVSNVRGGWDAYLKGVDDP